MIRHTYNGRPACTIEDLAELNDLTPKHVQQILYRETEAGRPVPVLDHCGRKALYDPRVFQRALGDRPGKGKRKALSKKPANPAA